MFTLKDGRQPWLDLSAMLFDELFKRFASRGQVGHFVQPIFDAIGILWHAACLYGPIW
jgi:hypothetical protein